MSRVGLKKFIGKATWYEAIYEKTRDDGKILLLDVKQKDKNKILAKHLFIDRMTVTLTQGDKVKFRGVAGNYRDLKGERKYNIQRIHKFLVMSEVYEEARVTSIHDSKNRHKRKR